MLQRVGSMKNPLDYQISKYDAVPPLCSMTRAIGSKGKIPPSNITLYCLDCYGSDGVCEKGGTFLRRTAQSVTTEAAVLNVRKTKHCSVG